MVSNLKSIVKFTYDYVGQIFLILLHVISAILGVWQLAVCENY